MFYLFFQDLCLHLCSGEIGCLDMRGIYYNGHSGSLSQSLLTNDGSYVFDTWKYQTSIRSYYKIFTTTNTLYKKKRDNVSTICCNYDYVSKWYFPWIFSFFNYFLIKDTHNMYNIKKVHMNTTYTYGINEYKFKNMKKIVCIWCKIARVILFEIDI